MKSIFLFFLLSLTLFVNAQNTGSNKKPLVLHLHIADVIDPRTNRYSQLGLEKANEIDADYVILELDTYGGALNDADDIRTRILNFDKPIYVFINKDAASAGALISIACDSIYMAKGASIGAATVVTQDGKAAPDKYQSYMRSIMRSTAEATGRDPRIAEGMVDEDIDVDSIATEGKVITFSVSEAIKHGFCNAEVSSIKDIMNRSGIEDYRIEKYELDTTEKIISFFINPMVNGILILIILGGIYFELQTPGVGFPILASLTAALLFFIPHYLNGLAENWEILLFISGIILLLLEAFVIPGFGIPGILGLMCTLGALALITLNNDALDFSFVSGKEIFTSIFTVLGGMLGAIILMLLSGSRLLNTNFFKRIALKETFSKEEGFTSNFNPREIVGKIGITYTVLRPSGKIEIDDTIYDAYTRGNYIEEGIKIKVISDEGTSLKVKEA